MNLKTIANQLLVYLSLLFFAVYTLGQLTRWQVLPGVAVYGHDLVIAISIGVWLLTQPRQALDLLQNFFGQRLVVLFLAWVGLGIALSAGGMRDAVVATAYLSRVGVYAWFTYLVCQQVKWSAVPLIRDRFLQPALKLFTFAGLFFLYFGLLQYALIPDTRFLSGLGWDDHYLRLMSTLLDPNYAGMLLVLTFFLWQTSPISMVKIMKKVISILLLLGIVLTFSRASYLALGLGSVLWLAREWVAIRVINWQITLYLVIFTIFMVIIPKPDGEGGNLLRTASIEARVTNLEQSVVRLQPYQWLFGRGWFVPLPQEADREEGLESLPDHAQVPDNLLVMLVSSLGVGGISILALLLYRWRDFFSRQPIWVQASLVAVLTHSMFNNTLFQPFIWLWVTGIVWLGYLQSKGDL